MNRLNHIKKAALLAGLVGILGLSGCIVVPAHRYGFREHVAIVSPIGSAWHSGYRSHGYYGWY